MSQDLGQLIMRLAARGERVVLVGAGEPMMILPLTEYDKLRADQFSTEMSATDFARPLSSPLEFIDPPQGGLADDNQYFPEPIEE